MGRTLTARVGSNIRIPIVKLDEATRAHIESMLTIDNPAKADAKKNNEEGWKDLPDYLELWEIDHDELILPRGFVFDLLEILDDAGFMVHWMDGRTKAKGFQMADPIDLFPYQEKIVAVAEELESGIIKAPTGSGKTVAMLEIVRRFPGRAIVIVNTKEIASQWMSRCRRFLGEDFPVGLVGEGKFDVPKRGLTIAIQATLWSKREQLDEEGFFDQFAVALLDECHHATARTYNDIFDRFSAQIRVGASATPEKTGEFELAKNVIGPIIVEVTEEEVADKIEKPIIEVIETRLGVSMKGKARVAERWTKTQNFNTAVKKLVEDEDRIWLIANEICENHFDNANIVISKRIAHLEAIYDALLALDFPDERLLPMVGAHEISERDAAIAATEDANCVMLTTLADEALDAPRLDRLHLVYPVANIELLLQQIGRVRRRHPDKTESIVIDYYDRHVKIFNKQYMARRHEVYGPKGFEVRKRKAGDPHATLA